jgi:hypothetical protein
MTVNREEITAAIAIAISMTLLAICVAAPVMADEISLADLEPASWEFTRTATSDKMCKDGLEDLKKKANGNLDSAIIIDTFETMLSATCTMKIEEELYLLYYDVFKELPLKL